MSTDLKKLLVYVQPEALQAFLEYKEKHNLKSNSKALNQILVSHLLGKSPVSHSQATNDFAQLEERIAQLENKNNSDFDKIGGYVSQIEEFVSLTNTRLEEVESIVVQLAAQFGSELPSESLLKTQEDELSDSNSDLSSDAPSKTTVSQGVDFSESNSDLHSESPTDDQCVEPRESNSESPRVTSESPKYVCSEKAYQEIDKTHANSAKLQRNEYSWLVNGESMSKKEINELLDLSKDFLSNHFKKKESFIKGDYTVTRKNIQTTEK
jgi:hypothetical protein